MKLTNKQYKMLSYISKHPNLSDVVKKFNTDYSILQEMLPKDSVYFENIDDDSRAKIFLKNDAQFAYEDYRRYTFTRLIAIASLLISLIALLKP